MCFRLFILTFALSLGAVFSGSAMAKDETVSGTVTYLNRSALPPGAILDVELVDVSRADAPSVTLSSRRYAMTGVPFPYELSYDDALIDEKMTYAIQARILKGETVLYRSTTHFPALTGDASEQVTVFVEQMQKTTAATLDGTWQVSEIAGRMLVSEKRPSISFQPDGMVAVDGGCNKFRGPVEISGATISFSDHMAGTLMACPPPYDKLEKDLLATLGDVSGWVRNGDQLALTNGAGVMVLRLNRAR